MSLQSARQSSFLARFLADPADPIFRSLAFAAATMLLVTLGGLIIALIIGGWPALSKFGLSFLFTNSWNPVTEVYGAAGPIVGTLITALLSLAIALPIAVCVSVFLTQYCPKVIAQPISTAIELLAGIPSIVYGMWGLFVFAPWFAKTVQLPILTNLDPESFWGKLLSGVPNGANIFTASIVLAIMILPYMAAVFRELFRSIPPHVREAAFGLGCTSFEVVGSVLIPYVKKGMIGVVMLGFGRALGETMAVTFIIGNSHRFPDSLFASGSTLASTIANEFNEAQGLHLASLIGLGLVLFLITFIVLAIARTLLSSQRY
ncbi:phosphate ABC transporter permease subunit PstC [Asticcacaulis sp. YBE204]|uniref:phosphate ABC transporter permease subunit PstC n=1 Tax=Asticcacaulis sp. YBE204 TaxID=1282363 RepID=UPI0003C4129F|nr:phosphate ABC transporter permease subunit PstC [Asticcacaulis sp. YBE204]ESQ78946.1 phosphate transporter permease subunit PstC [Asticcacaulis sp. YBE204]